MPDTPYQMLGGREAVMTLAQTFYDAMERDEPALTAVHQTDPEGAVTAATRARFGLFLVGWLGGPPDYEQRFGHPRLRRRHAHVPINLSMRDAWLRCMGVALDVCEVRGEVRGFLDQRFAEVAEFLRNQPD